MIWTINAVFCLVLTSVTGSIVFGFWYFIGQWLEKAGFPNILYLFMKLVLIFFAFPVLYVVMLILDRTYGIYRGDLFLHTKVIMTVCGILFVVWAGISCFILLRQMYLVYRANQLFKERFECEKYKKEIFMQIEQKMGISDGKVELAQCYQAPTAVLWGIIRPVVILPVEDYSDEELKVIFIHELTHYKHKDILWRRIASVLIGVHFFNPLIWKFHRLLRKWSEHACDFEVYETAGGISHYFNTIVKIQVNSQRLHSYFAVHLSENENELVERVRRMKIQKEIKKRAAWKAAIICAVMLASSSVIVCAASKGVAEAYHVVYDATDVEEEEMASPEMPEYEESGETEGIVEEIGEVDIMSRSSGSFNWSVSNGVRKTTTGFSAKSRGGISVTAYISPIDKTVRAGIIEPDGTRRYITGKKYLSGDFSLNQSGTYKVYVENNSVAKITAEGTYYIR